MLAFRDWHSVIEVKRYLERFMMYAPGLTHLQGILHTEYNEYDSIIKPMLVWLEAQGVQFMTGTHRDRTCGLSTARARPWSPA